LIKVQQVEKMKGGVDDDAETEGLGVSRLEHRGEELDKVVVLSEVKKKEENCDREIISVARRNGKKKKNYKICPPYLLIRNRQGRKL
jgi:hypothetical protein